jgi:hypothetical protein
MLKNRDYQGDVLCISITIAAVNRMDCLLTWNFKHSVNAAMRAKERKS